MSQVFEEIELMLIEVAAELFAAYETQYVYAGPCSRHASSDDGESVLATIGFAAEGTKGSLVLVATRATVTALRPPEVGGTDDDALCDVLGEFSNMLLGRLKNRLLGRGLTLMLAVPAAAVVERLRLQMACAERSAWHAFQWSDNGVRIRLEATLCPDVSLTDDATQTPARLAEGEIVLF